VNCVNKQTTTKDCFMSTVMAEISATATARAVIPAGPPVIPEPKESLRLVQPIDAAPVPEEITFLDDHPLVPVFVIGAISLALAVAAVGSIVFWLAIRYSGVLAP
jgi:hypothetical protein